MVYLIIVQDFVFGHYSAVNYYNVISYLECVLNLL